MIVRVSGIGQFELDDAQIRRLDALDTTLTEAFQGHNEHAFQHALVEMVRFVCSEGVPLEQGRLVTSDVIVPPEDVTISEAEGFFTDEGLMQPLTP